MCIRDRRKGLGLSGGPWFVIRKDINENIIYVSRGYDTEKDVYKRQARKYFRADFMVI